MTFGKMQADLAPAHFLVCHHDSLAHYKTAALGAALCLDLSSPNQLLTGNNDKQ